MAVHLDLGVQLIEPGERLQHEGGGGEDHHPGRRRGGQQFDQGEAGLTLSHVWRPTIVLSTTVCRVAPAMGLPDTMR